MPVASWRSLRTVAGWTRGAATAVAVACYAYMVVAVTIQVVGRYLLPIQIGNAVETAAFAQVWLAALGAAYALRTGAVFAVDILPSLLPLPLARAVSLLLAAVSLCFLGVMIYGGVLLTQRGFHQTSPTLLLPMWTVFIAIPTGMAVMAIEVVVRVADRWDDPFRQVEDQGVEPA